MGALDNALLQAVRANGASKGRPYFVGAKTANYTVQPQDCYGGLITNEGATGSVTLTLPPAVAGMSLQVYLMASKAVVIDPQDDEKIVLAGVAGDAGDRISADAAGEYVRLACVEDGEWVVTEVGGTWTAENDEGS